MKKLIVFITAVLLLSTIEVEAQIKIGDLAGSALNFLTTNPKTANNMKPEERIALNLVGNLFRTSAERKHDLEVASQSRDQITYKYGNEGQTVSIVKDPQGNVYLLVGEIVYPVSNEFLMQAVQQIQAPPQQVQTQHHPPQPPAISYLPEYSLRKLKTSYKGFKRTIFFFSEYNDDNGNGRGDFKEFHGKSRNFNKGNVKILSTFVSRGKSVATFKLEIFNSKGEIIHSEVANPERRFYPILILWFEVPFTISGDYKAKVTITNKDKKGKIKTYYLQDQVRIF